MVFDVPPPVVHILDHATFSNITEQMRSMYRDTMTPRLDTPPKMGEDVNPVGFGRCALSPDGIRRKERPGGTIRALTSETIFLDASVCPGDSGGPVFAKGTREIVGVVSLSAMDHDEHTRGPSVMARIDAYRSVFAHARMIADGIAQNELPPLECTRGLRD